MSDEQFRQDIQAIYQQMRAVNSCMMHLAPGQQRQVAEALQEITAALDHLQLLYEEMQTSLEASDVVEEELLVQNQQALAERQYYYDLFQYCPDAYALVDADGLILEANQALARLLNVPQSHLAGQSLAAFVADVDDQKFCTLMSQLFAMGDVQHCEMSLRPRQGKPFAALLKVAIAGDNWGAIEALRIGVHDINQYKQVVTQTALALTWEDLQAQVTTPLTSLPPALDGLQVLVVDDEADAREFISALLESQGIRAIAVATAAEALEALEKFHPNVLISDIRMPNEDGYTLIRKVRELEAKTGWHVPAAALTAYLAEDRSKALSAGFESHLHKLAQPAELIEMVAKLAGRATTSASTTRRTEYIE